MSNMYERGGSYSKQNPDFNENYTEWKANKIFKLISRNNLHPKIICDIGCGSGGISYNLHKLIPDCKFNGYDINPDAIDLCLKKKNDMIDFKCSDFSKENISCDIILLIDVIEHLEDYFKYMNDIKYRSKYKILHIPLENFVIALMYQQFQLNQMEKVGHLHFFTKDLILKILENLGYEIIDYEYTTTMEIDLDDWGWKDKLISIPRKLLFPITPDLTSNIFGGYSILVLVKTKTFL